MVLLKKTNRPAGIAERQLGTTPEIAPFPNETILGTAPEVPEARWEIARVATHKR